LVKDGRLDGLQNTPGHCSCELQVAKDVDKAPELSRLATTDEIRQQELEAKKIPITSKAPAAAKEEPVYQVFMPPLSYDAHAAVQNDNFDPKLILLVRRVRVRPTLIFQGRVEEPAAAPKAIVAKAPAPAPATSSAAAPAQNDDSLVNRVRAFFRRLFS
jgi:hypothetical protein